MWAPTWNWILLANVLLGVSQGLTWSSTVIMKIDLVGPLRRGLAIRLNEFAGYGAVSLTALLTGYNAASYGLRPEPFYPGVGFAVIGLTLSMFLAHETHGHLRTEIQNVERTESETGSISQWQIFKRTSLTDRDLSSVSQAGLVNNSNDGMAWGLFPLLYAATGLSLAHIGCLAAIYPAVWGFGQPLTGACRIGPDASALFPPACGSRWRELQRSRSLEPSGALPVVLFLLGIGMVYPTLLAAIGDVAHPAWRAGSVGVYRLWQNLGYAFGALLAGVVADALGVRAAIGLVGGLTFASGLIVAVRMRETKQSRLESSVLSSSQSARPLGH